MIDIKLARVDFRLMHGQVVTTWLKQVSADAILIVDDELASDKFLAQVFLMAAPPGVKVSIKSISKAVQGIEKDVYRNLHLLVLFKSVEKAEKAINAGFPIKDLQIGSLGGEKGKIMISNENSLSHEEADILEELAKKGIKITLQVTPKDPLITLDEALRQIRK